MNWINSRNLSSVCSNNWLSKKASEQAQLNQLQQIQGQLARLPLEQQQQQSMLASELSQLQQQKTELMARGELVLTAPVAGRRDQPYC